MNAARDDGVTLSKRQYRWLDRVTKLLGVALVAGGLEAGGATPEGLALAAAGVVVGLLTTVIRSES